MQQQRSMIWRPGSLHQRLTGSWYPALTAQITRFAPLALPAITGKIHAGDVNVTSLFLDMTFA